MKFTVFSMPTFDDALGLSQGEFLRALVDHLATADRHEPASEGPRRSRGLLFELTEATLFSHATLLEEPLNGPDAVSDRA